MAETRLEVIEEMIKKQDDLLKKPKGSSKKPIKKVSKK